MADAGNYYLLHSHKINVNYLMRFLSQTFLFQLFKNVRHAWAEADQYVRQHRLSLQL